MKTVTRALLAHDTKATTMFASYLGSNRNV